MSKEKRSRTKNRAGIIRGTAKHCMVLCAGENGVSFSRDCSPSESLAMVYTVLMTLGEKTEKEDPNSNTKIMEACKILGDLLIDLGFESAGDVYRQSKKESQ